MNHFQLCVMGLGCTLCIHPSFGRLNITRCLKMRGTGILQHLFLAMILPGKTVICFSVEDQMEQSSLYFWDLLEGSEKPVVGTTCECLI